MVRGFRGICLVIVCSMFLNFLLSTLCKMSAQVSSPMTPICAKINFYCTCTIVKYMSIYASLTSKKCKFYDMPGNARLKVDVMWVFFALLGEINLHSHVTHRAEYSVDSRRYFPALIIKKYFLTSARDAPY